VELAGRALGDVGFVGEQDDRAAGGVQLVEQLQDIGGRAGVQVAGGLVGQDERRVRDQGSSDRDALLLAAGEFVRPVLDTVAEADAFQCCDGRRRRTSRATPAYDSGSSTLRAADCKGSRLNCWKTNPMRWLRTTFADSAVRTVC